MTINGSLKKKQFGVICFVEMWERYAFYSFQTLFMLFFTSKSIGDEFSVTDTLTVPLKEARESFEKQYLVSQLKKFGGNISKTAKFIGMERSALHRKLKLLGVKDLN